MLSFAHDLVARATRLFIAGSGEPALWTISVRSRVVGTLVEEAAGRRLTWFDGADRRLTNYTGPIDGDVEALERAFGLRLGTPVNLDSLPV
jgi:hypothetical protein